MDTHDMNNLLTKLQMKAQLWGKVPIERLNLRDTREKISVGYLAALMELSETIDRLHREAQVKPVPGRVTRWLGVARAFIGR